jgi:DNA-binding MarR family transcriptional regulator
MAGMSNRSTLIETERAMSAQVGALPLDFRAAHAVSSLYRAANAVRNHLTNTVLREHDLSWTSFVVLWVVWIWDGMETRHAAEHAAISKATLTGVVKTLVSRGLLTRRADTRDRRLVHLALTPEGEALMKELYPAFNAVEAQVVACLPPQRIEELTESLRSIVTGLEQAAGGPAVPATTRPA